MIVALYVIDDVMNDVDYVIKRDVWLQKISKCSKNICGISKLSHGCSLMAFHKLLKIYNHYLQPVQDNSILIL